MTFGKFEIPGKFIGRNEAERLARSHWSKANEVKRDETQTAMLYARQSGIGPVDGPVDVCVAFREMVSLDADGNLKRPRDADNVMAGCKPVLDGMVKAGIFQDDGPKWVRRVIPVVRYVLDGPRITVAVMPYEPARVVTYPPVDLPGEEF